jgi:hypothetical protein
MASQNLGGTFAGDVASLTRLATSGEFAEYLQEQIFLKSRLINSGFVARSDQLLSSTTGVRVEAPFFRPLDPIEERMTSANDWGQSGEGHVTYQKITAGTQYATITHRIFAYAIDKLSKLATGEDPLRVLGEQLQPAMDKLMTGKCIAHLEGLLGTGGPLNATSSLNKSVTTGSTIANWLTAENVIEARYKLGERQSELTTLFIPSPVQAYLEQLGFLTYEGDRRGVNARLLIGNAYNLNVVVDDQLPVIGATGQQRQFVCYLGGAGAVLEGEQIPLEIEYDRNAPSKQDGLIVDYHHAYHVPGTTWAANYDNPLNAQLATGASFGLAYNEPRLIPLVRLVVNSPYGGVI